MTVSNRISWAASAVAAASSDSVRPKPSFNGGREEEFHMFWDMTGSLLIKIMEHWEGVGAHTRLHWAPSNEEMRRRQVDGWTTSHQWMKPNTQGATLPVHLTTFPSHVKEQNSVTS